MKNRGKKLPCGRKATLPMCQRVPSNVTQGDRTNICNNQDKPWQQRSECDSNVEHDLHSSSLSDLAIKQTESKSIPIFHSNTYIGQIKVNTHLVNASSGPSIELDFYIARYLKVKQYYIDLQKYRTLKNPRKLQHGNKKCIGTGLPSVDQYDMQMVWLQNCIETYLPNLTKIYEFYSHFMADTDQESNEGLFEPVLTRLAFWQMLRDYRLQKQFDSLVSLEIILQQNPYLSRMNRNEKMEKSDLNQRVEDANSQYGSLTSENDERNTSSHTHSTHADNRTAPANAMEPTMSQSLDPRVLDPFDRMAFPEFVHYMLELAWCLYSGQRATYKTTWPTHLAGCLFRLIKETFKKHGEEGQVLRNARYKRMIPKLYHQFAHHVGNPVPVRHLVRLFKFNQLHPHDSFTNSDCWVLFDQLDETRFGYIDRSYMCDQSPPNYKEDAGDASHGDNKLFSPPSKSFSSIDSCESTMKLYGETTSSCKVFVCESSNEPCVTKICSEIIKTHRPDKGILDPDYSVPLDFTKSLFKLEVNEFFDAIALVCPRLMSAQGFVINVSMSLNFLEYFESLVLFCEMNADKTCRLLKAETTEMYYMEYVIPVIEREKAAKAGVKKPTGPGGTTAAPPPVAKKGAAPPPAKKK
uniref:Uncharacterized protein n=1 Tax=Cacopsylla melanoneura TaxID=428564 RepID=A0A8D9BL43_9HEMI